MDKQKSKISIVISMLTAVMILIVSICGFACGKKSNNDDGFDYGSLPFYIEDTSTLGYSYTDEERVRPFWLGNVMRNEIVMVSDKNGVVEGRLLFTPTKVLAVYDWKLGVEYEEGVDYTVTGNKITIVEGSKIPVFNDDWAYGKNMPAGFNQVSDMNVVNNNYRLFDCLDEDGNAIKLTYTEGDLIFKNYIHVSYVYDPAEFDYTLPNTYSNQLPFLTNKLENGEDFTMVVFGDSISEGCSSSAKWDRHPYTPFYGDLVKAELERIYGVNITLHNMSLGGKTTKWAVGTETADGGGGNLMKLRNYAPDLLVIAFGGNDFNGGTTSAVFNANIETIIENAVMANENCQIILINTFPANSVYKSSNYDYCAEEYRVFKETHPECVFVDMKLFTDKMLEVKEYYEVSASNVNHPNDFIHRIYAMNIMCALTDYSVI